jgi:hypothetical protein
MAYPDPIIGYRQFVDGVCRAVFEDPAGRQYVFAGGGERVYSVYLTDGITGDLQLCVLTGGPWR